MAQETEAWTLPAWRPKLSDFDYQRPVTLPSTLSHQAEGRYRDSKMEYPELELDPDVRPLRLVGLPPAPPPPPHPSPPPFSNSPTDVVPTKHPYSNFSKNRNQHLIQLEDRYEGVRDARLDLKGSRFRLQLERRKLRNIRQELGEKEGSALSQLRRFLQEEGVTLPDYIEKAVQEVDDIRDLLGTREAEYEATEHDFDLQETRYESKEAKLMDSLLEDLDSSAIELNVPESNRTEPEPSMTQVTEHKVSQNGHSNDFQSNNEVNWWRVDLLEIFDLRNKDPHLSYLTSSLAEYDWGKDILENKQIVSNVGAQFPQSVQCQDEKTGVWISGEFLDADHLSTAEPQHVPFDSGIFSNTPISITPSANQVVSQQKGRPDLSFTDADTSGRPSPFVDVRAEDGRTALLGQKSHVSLHRTADMRQVSRWIKEKPPFAWIRDPLRKKR